MAAKFVKARTDQALVRHQRLFENRLRVCLTRLLITVVCTAAGAVSGGVSGAVVGLVVGILLQEAICMRTLRPRTNTQYLPIPEYRKIRWWYAMSTTLLVAWTLAGLVLYALLERDIMWWSVYWGMPWVVCFIAGSCFCAIIENWRCPTCDNAFLPRGAFASYPHVCDRCGFTIRKVNHEAV